MLNIQAQRNSTLNTLIGSIWFKETSFIATKSQTSQNENKIKSRLRVKSILPTIRLCFVVKKLELVLIKNVHASILSETECQDKDRFKHECQKTRSSHYRKHLENRLKAFKYYLSSNWELIVCTVFRNQRYICRNEKNLGPPTPKKWSVESF